MIYVTGDLHADLGRFKSKGFHKLRKNDSLIVCGDFGFLWTGDKHERHILKKLGRHRYNLLFVDGTHDNHAELAKYPVVEFAGAPAHQISGRCYHLMRGEIYNIEGKSIFAFGGGESTDMDMRIEGVNWWRQELPSRAELEHARENLEKAGNAVDYIVTHSPSTSMHGFLNMDQARTDHLGAFLDEVSRTVKYKHWYFGRYHQDKVIPPLHHVVYQAVLPLGSSDRSCR